MKENYKNALFVSDLDGTLFGGGAKIPDVAAEHLRILAKAGVSATFATARTLCTVGKILDPVPRYLPVALMNGVLLYSFPENRYVSVRELSVSTFSEAARLINDAGLSPFYYFLDGNGKLHTCYERISCAAMENFMRERREKFGKPFDKITREQLYASADRDADLHEKEAVNLELGTPVYFCVIGEKDVVKSAAALCRSLKGIRVECYGDPYSDAWYLEAFSALASKKSAVEELKRLTGSERVVAFGDNFNDIPMFEAADEAYAVRTAPREVVSAANGTIDPPEEYGVTRKIGELTGISL